MATSSIPSLDTSLTDAVSSMSKWTIPGGAQTNAFSFLNGANVAGNTGYSNFANGVNPALDSFSLFPHANKSSGTGFLSSFTPDQGLPEKQGGWMQGANLAIGALQAGTGIYSAIQQAKMNDFMKSYYKDQMNLMKTDFANSARSANEALAGKQQRTLSAQGYATDSEEMQQGVAAHMAKWGAKETV